MKLNNLVIILSALALCNCAGLSGMHTFTQQIGVQTQKAAQSNSYQYLIYLPKDYSAKSSEKYPVLIFLHGSGERGSEIEKVKIHGPPRLIKEGKDFPFIVISPQLPESKMWEADKLDATLDYAIKGLNADKGRIYLTGLSLGGMGTWGWASAHPKKFAAIAPVCGMSNPMDATKFLNLPIWAFHGAKDDIVPPKGSSFMVNMINDLGGNAKITIYPDANHDSWTETYNNEEFYKWLLQQKTNQ